MKYNLISVKDIPARESIQFVSDSREVLSVLESISMEDCKEEYGSLFVEVEDGDYLHIWALGGIVPYLDATAIELL